ncbi:thermonuclease family protein [Roseobacter sp.]|uniref:thermonuclease family protein n=1 Tax=Roseobacter sp. TaxID=1907202 RepID=UPI00385A5EB9
MFFIWGRPAAPENVRGRVDPHGKASTKALEDLALGREIICYLDGTRANRRPVGVCVLDGQDLGRVMVEIGAARDCPAYSLGRYSAAEDQAKKNGHNLSIDYSLPPYC